MTSSLSLCICDHLLYINLTIIPYVYTLPVKVAMSFLNLLVLPLEGGLLLLVTYLVINEIIRWRLRIKGLPGPRGLPVVGNLPQV